MNIFTKYINIKIDGRQTIFTVLYTSGWTILM